MSNDWIEVTRSNINDQMPEIHTYRITGTAVVTVGGSERTRFTIDQTIKSSHGTAKVIEQAEYHTLTYESFDWTTGEPEPQVQWIEQAITKVAAPYRGWGF